MLNQVMLIGNLGKDPEVRYASSTGEAIVSFSLATTDKWKDKQSGESKEATEWHNVTIFAPGLCTVAEQYLHKGSRVFVQGRLQTRKWTDDNGVDRWNTNVVLTKIGGRMVLLGDPKGGTRPSDAPAPSDLDDEIPF